MRMLRKRALAMMASTVRIEIRYRTNDPELHRQLLRLSTHPGALLAAMRRATKEAKR